MKEANRISSWADSDAAMPAGERLPASFIASFFDDGRTLRLFIDGIQAGDVLTDAKRDIDGYRFHDVLHLAFAVRLGWSPVLRSMLGRKRRSDPVTDECEDGGRACMVEEAVCHLIHVHHRDFGDRGWGASISLVMRMVKGFEVERCSAAQWAGAINVGLRVREQLEAAKGGTVSGDRRTGRLALVTGAVR